jgi:GNAT superfamily N-acetyltransferase
MILKKKPNGYWTDEKVMEEALKYDTPGNFQKGSKGAYLKALRSKTLDIVCAHMKIKTYWTEKSLNEDALKYNSRMEFRKGSPSAYQIAYERGILDKICNHMEALLTYWADSLIKKEALKYDNRTDFRIKSPGAYNAARRKGTLDKVCSHMIPIRTYWTDEMLQEEALKYISRVDFQNAGGSAYTLSLNRKLTDKICGHMKASARSSNDERAVLSFISELNLDTMCNSRKIIPPLELDIFIPSLNLGIEYCGLYWHSEESKGKNYHRDKQKMCNEKGIRLITIFEDEWLDRNAQVKGFLKSVLNKNETKIFARKTDLRIVNKEEAELFLEQNHIQGSATMDKAFGLYFNEELLAIITGNQHHRQGQENIYVLNRLAFKSGVSIAGGSSRLLKALISYAKEQGYHKLISWSDNRWSEGRVYEKMGFTLEEEMGPDYSYIKQQKRISKQSCQKKNLIKKGAIGTMENTEKELALSLGLIRIYDCGKKRWVMDLSSK